MIYRRRKVQTFYLRAFGLSRCPARTEAERNWIGTLAIFRALARLELGR